MWKKWKNEKRMRTKNNEQIKYIWNPSCLNHTHTHTSSWPHPTHTHTHTYIIYALYKCVKLAAYEKKELKLFEKETNFANLNKK